MSDYVVQATHGHSFRQRCFAADSAARAQAAEWERLGWTVTILHLPAKPQQLTLEGSWDHEPQDTGRGAGYPAATGNAAHSGDPVRPDPAPAPYDPATAPWPVGF